MMFTNQLTTLLVVSCSFFIAGAAPLTVDKPRRDVADPSVTAPNSTTIWVVGETQTVIWNTSNLPKQITNTNGTVLLGYMNDTTSGEHLMVDNPLASGFDIRSGSVSIMVPDVEPRTDYIIALLGDSGNISDKFTIKSSSGSAASSATPSSTTLEMVSSSASSISSDNETTKASTDPVASPSGTSATLVTTSSAASGSSPISDLSPSSGTPSLTSSPIQGQTATTSSGAASLRAQAPSSLLTQLAASFLAVWLFA